MILKLVVIIILFSGFGSISIGLTQISNHLKEMNRLEEIKIEALSHCTQPKERKFSYVKN